MNFGQNWPKRAEMRWNLICGGMEGITIMVYTPIQDIPVVPTGIEWDP